MKKLLYAVAGMLMLTFPVPLLAGAPQGGDCRAHDWQLYD